MSKSEPFFNGGQMGAKCVVCRADFLTKASHRKSVCSDACKRTRSLQYGAAYRQQNRETRLKLLALFGGKVPTKDQIENFIRLRKSAGQS